MVRIYAIREETMNQTPQVPNSDQTPAVKKRSAGRILLTCLHIFLIVLPVVTCGAAVYLHAVYPNENWKSSGST